MCGPHFCSMKITQDVREHAAQKEIDEQAALDLGMKEKAEEFEASGGERFIRPPVQSEAPCGDGNSFAL